MGSHGTLPPRGSRRHRTQELTLPTLLALYSHGLAEGRVATYGFLVWDVGGNRLLMEHAAVAGEGPEVTATSADYRAIIEGLNWLIREGHHRRRITAHIDSRQVYEQLSGDRPVPEEALWPLVQEAQRALRAFPQLSLRLVSQKSNWRAVQLAADAYVAVLEARRLKRVPAVLGELRSIGSDVFLVGDRYRVDLAAGTCNCPDFRAMHSERYPVRCKHLLAAMQAKAARKGKG